MDFMLWYGGTPVHYNFTSDIDSDYMLINWFSCPQQVIILWRNSMSNSEKQNQPNTNDHGRYSALLIVASQDKKKFILALGRADRNLMSFDLKVSINRRTGHINIQNRDFDISVVFPALFSPI
jgi:hypothetical protein